MAHQMAINFFENIKIKESHITGLSDTFVRTQQERSPPAQQTNAVAYCVMVRIELRIGSYCRHDDSQWYNSRIRNFVTYKKKGLVSGICDIVCVDGSSYQKRRPILILVSE